MSEDMFGVLGAPLSEGDDKPLDWKAAAVKGEEGINQLFAFAIELTAPVDQLATKLGNSRAETVEDALLGQPVWFRVGRSTTATKRYGVVASVAARDLVYMADKAHLPLTVEVVPQLWQLHHRRNSRIFQRVYLDEIVSTVLAEHGVRHRWELANPYPRRVYCTQYQETDLEFVLRLLAEEGILFFFEHGADFKPEGTPQRPVEYPEIEKEPDGGIGGALGTLGDLGTALGTDDQVGASIDEDALDPTALGKGSAGPAGAGEVMVFVDRPSYRPAAEPGLHLDLRPDPGMITNEKQVGEFNRWQRVRPLRVELHDYDFKRPMMDLRARYQLSASDEQTERFEDYDHHGEYLHPDSETLKAKAAVHLEQHRAETVVWQGRSANPLLAAGHGFELQDPNVERQGAYAVVRICHDWRSAAVPMTDEAGETAVVGQLPVASQPHIKNQLERHRLLPQLAVGRGLSTDEAALEDTYQNRFEAVAKTVPYRPPRPPRRLCNTTESAVVVGPVGQDIYTDKYGRVKVQFHWDRHGRFNEKSSCWVRVLHPWAGSGWGFQFIPRIGMEVVVAFLGGDPDRPVVMGSLFNETHPLVEKLPLKAARSGIRSQTTPDGGGFNELTFDDRKGEERVFLKAQFDLTEEVGHNHTLTVNERQDLTVGADQRIGVKTDRFVGVGGHSSTLIGANRTEAVGANRSTVVKRNSQSRIEGNTVERVDGVAVRAVDRDELIEVNGSRNLSVHGSSLLHVGGGSSGDPNPHASVFVDGPCYVTATDGIIVRAEKPDGKAASLRLECGDTFVELDGENITLRAKNILVQGDDTTRVLGGKGELKLAKGADLRHQTVDVQAAGGGRMQLDANARLQGAELSLTKPAPPGAESATDDTESFPPNVDLTFTHLWLKGDKAIAKTRYRVTVADRVEEGTTDEKGRLKFHAPEDADVAQVTLWANESYPEVYPPDGGPLEWLVRLCKKLEPADSAQGAAQRLRNLGYDPADEAKEPQLAEIAVQGEGPPLRGATAAAVRAFQHDRRDEAPLVATGQLDEDTVTELEKIYE